MVGLSLGLGLGLGSNNSPHRRKASQNQRALCKAIDNRLRVTAKFNGSDIMFHPYALSRENGSQILLAIVLWADDEALASFTPQPLAISGLTEIEVTKDVFVPNYAFKTSAVGGFEKPVCVVDFVQGIDDSLQAETSEAETV